MVRCVSSSRNQTVRRCYNVTAEPWGKLGGGLSFNFMSQLRSGSRATLQLHPKHLLSYSYPVNTSGLVCLGLYDPLFNMFTHNPAFVFRSDRNPPVLRLNPHPESPSVWTACHPPDQPARRHPSPSFTLLHLEFKLSRKYIFNQHIVEAWPLLVNEGIMKYLHILHRCMM